MSKKCENCKSEQITEELNSIELCDTCYRIELIAIDELHKLIGTMLISGIPAKSILERFDLYNSLQS